MKAEDLIALAAACQTCGKEHRYIRTSPHSASWAASDGHNYRPNLDIGTVAKLRQLATGVYKSPWVPEKAGLLRKGNS